MRIMKVKTTVAILLICVFLSGSFSTAENAWDLTRLYASEVVFLDSLNEILERKLPLMTEYAGELYNDGKLLDFFVLYEQLSVEANRLYLYASLLADIDSTASTYQAYKNQALDVHTKLNVSTSFMNPEILMRSDEELYNLIDDPSFKPYVLYIERLIKNRDYILSENEERLLALMTPLVQMPREIYTHLTLSDAQYNHFTNHLGKSAPFNVEWDPIYLYTDRSDLRARTYETLYSPYSNNAHTIATIYTNEVLKNSFQAKARGYESALSYSLSGVMTTETYHLMIQSARDNVHLLHNYLRLKKNGMGLDSLKTSDLHLNYATEWNTNIVYEEALKSIQLALQPLGPSYLDTLNQFLSQETIDVYPNDYKTRSQYSWGVYDGPIYILLNYQELFSDVTTLSHELGHAIHQTWLHENQHFFDTQINPFPGEIPSIVNEFLVLEHFIAHSELEEEALAYNVHKLDFLMSTFFEQVMLADFELQIHEMADRGEALSLDILNQVWLEIVHFYYGPDVEVETFYTYHWMTIPHLYANHYVYAYVMSLTAAQSITQQLASDTDFLERYHTFLKSTTVDAPLEKLTYLNIDFNDATLYHSIYTEMDRLTQMIESEIKTPTFTVLHKPELITLDTVENVFEHYDVPYKDADSALSKWIVVYAVLLTLIALALLIYIRRLKKNLAV